MLTVAIVLFVAATLAFVGSRMSRADEPALSRWLARGSMLSVTLGAIFVGGACYTSVPPAHMGVVTTLGKITDDPSLPGGPHLILPVSRSNNVFIGLDVAEAKGAEAGSRDLQSIHSTLTVNFEVDRARAKELFSLNPALNYREAYVVPALYEVFKAVVSHYTAEELITKRQEVSSAITTALNTKLSAYYLRVQSVNLVNFGFSKAFNDAIEEKVTASQKAATAERNLDKAKFDAQARVAQAEGEAKAISIQAQAIEKQSGENYVRLQAIQKWNGVLPQNTQGAIPFINVGK